MNSDRFPMLQVIKRKWREERYRQLCLYFLIVFSFLLLFLLMAVFKLNSEILLSVTHLENRDEEQFVRNLTSDMVIEQSFVSPHDFDYLTLSCSDHDMNLTGKILVQVWEQNNSMDSIVSMEIENNRIKYQQPVEIHFSEAGKKNITYLIRITGVGTAEDAIGFFGYLPDNREAAARVNGKISEYALSLGTHTRTALFGNLSVIIFLLIFIGLGVLIYMLFCDHTAPEKLFFVLAVPLALAFLSFMSVNFIHDGDAHFSRAYHYANLLLGVADDNPNVAITMRKDDSEVIYGNENMNARNAQNMWHIYQNWNWFVKDRTLVYEVPCRSAGTTNILLYIPGVLGIVIARLIGLGAYPMLYFAKILALITYIFGVYHAIKVIPVGKHLLVLLAALPMSMQQATGITYDTITSIVLFLFIAYSLRLYYHGLGKAQWIIFTLVCLMLGICKGGIYTPMLIFLLFIPQKHMCGLKKKLLFITMIGLAVMTVTIIGYGSTIRSYVFHSSKERQNTAAVSEESEQESDKDEQKAIAYGIGHVYREPVHFIRLLVNTLMIRGEDYVSSMLGNGVAWAVEKLPAWSYAIFGILLLLAKNSIGESEYRISGKMRFGLLLSGLLTFLAYHVLFLVETPLTYDYIWGIQGRYFISQFFVLLLVLRNNGIKQEKGTEKLLYLGYYLGLILFLFAYTEIFMTQTYV